MIACHALCAIGGVKAVVDCRYIYIPAENALRQTRHPMRSKALSSIFSQEQQECVTKHSIKMEDETGMVWLHVKDAALSDGRRVC